ncbi:MAG TPA: type I methionyl aminopeptidase [Candidatus Saccharimonadales bacterium]|nr:type I methionyl aminopeptidase [Candidatus Saccharimonadales bacterium]
MSAIKTEAEIEAMRASGRILATVLDTIRRKVRAGMTPKDISKMAVQELGRLGGKPTFKGFDGGPGVPRYPDIICISNNNEVQHGIPNDRPFHDGDIVNFDFGVTYEGMVTDGGITVSIGGLDKADDAGRRLLEGTERALYAGLGQVKDGCHVGDISAAIEQVLRQYDLGIVRELVGHGVGHQLHEEPDIPNYGHTGTGPILKSGMTIAVEPITTLGDHHIFQTRDGWTLMTQDGSRSAQFEHTVLVTRDGCEILTQL